MVIFNAQTIGASQQGQFHGRGEWIRTTGPCLPKTVLYQAELHPELVANTSGQATRRACRVSNCVIAETMALLSGRW